MSIVSDPGIFAGKPVIQGTRITVAHILSCLGAGWSLEEVAREHALADEQVRAALAWAGDLLDWDHGAS